MTEQSTEKPKVGNVPHSANYRNLNDIQIEASGPELVAGVAHGIRGWALDDMDRLTGMSFIKYVWNPGENVAACRDLDCPCPGASNLPKTWRIWSCSSGAGFYAYHDGVMDYAAPRPIGDPDVVGVIRGYGPTIVGERGFRSTKAMIEAICPAESGNPFKRADNWLFDVCDQMGGIAVPTFIVSMMLEALMIIICAISLIWPKEPGDRQFSSPMVLISCGGFLWLTAFILVGAAKQGRLKRGAPPVNTKEARIKKAAELYGVPFYKNRRAMLKSHPIDKINPVPELDPASEEFWTLDPSFKKRK